jgi:hypothetical protein
MAVQWRENKIKTFLARLRFLDYLIILIVLLFGIIFFRFFNPDERWINAAVVANNIPFFQVNAFHVDDIEKDPSGEKIAEIAGIQIYDTPKSLVANKDVFIRLKLLVRVNPRSGELEYKNKIIKIGSPIELRFNTGRINGKLAELSEKDQEEKLETKTLSLVLYEQWPWLADSIKVGDGEKYGSGQKIIEILSKEIRSAEVTVTTAGGETLKRIDPRKVDITLKVRIQAVRFGDQLIFRQDERVIIGELISFNAGNTRVKEALIEKIE